MSTVDRFTGRRLAHFEGNYYPDLVTSFQSAVVANEITRFSIVWPNAKADQPSAQVLGYLNLIGEPYIFSGTLYGRLVFSTIVTPTADRRKLLRVISYDLDPNARVITILPQEELADLLPLITNPSNNVSQLCANLRPSPKERSLIYQQAA